MPNYKINQEKTYQFPIDLCIVNFNNVHLVVAPQTAKWIVLETAGQLEVLNYLRAGHSIGETLNNSRLDKQDISIVITQIEARRLCNNNVRSVTEDKRALHLYLTNKCNLSCPHCYMFSGKQNDNELTTQEIIKLLTDYVQIAAGHRITISGGEPSIHKDFKLIVETASKLGLEVNVLTNGSLMSRSNIEELSKFITSVQISIDGFSEETDAIIRGKGHFSKALLAVEEFVYHGVETSIAITPTLELLRNHQEEYSQFAKGLAMKYAGKTFRVKFTETLSTGRQVSLTEEENKEYANIVTKINRSIYDEDFELITFVETMRNNIIKDNCMFGVFAVASNGDVYLCPEIGDLLPIANIRTNSFKDIYEKSQLAEKVTTISNLRPCNDCVIRNICGGGCRIKEFPKLTRMTSFEKINYEEIPPRSCEQKIKDNFYDLMVRSNEYLFLPLMD